MFGRKRKLDDFGAEIEAHLQLEFERQRELGLSEEEARAAARRAFGNVMQAKERFYESSRWLWWDQFWQDVRYGVRTLRKSPGFAVVAVLTLALGIGANTSIFSVVNAVLLRSLPYREAGRLVYLYEDGHREGFPREDFTPANYIDCKKDIPAFEDVAAVDGNTFNLTGGGGEPERLWGYMHTWNLFPMLGASPMLGREFTVEEDQPGHQDVVLLSYRLWKRRFGGDSAILGKDILLNEQKYTVLGVMPPGFSFPDKEVDLWMPRAFRSDELQSRGEHYLSVYARLREGVSIKQANAELSVLAQQLRQQHMEVMQFVDGFVAEPLQQSYTRDVRTPLMVLLAAVGLILVIACANVANLLLSRAALREPEVALRTALGASRSRIVRQLLTESTLLSCMGGGLGVLLAACTFGFLEVLIPTDLSRTVSLQLNVQVLGTTVLISLVCVMLFGLAPALRISRRDSGVSLKQGARGTASQQHQKLGNLLVIAEIAMCLMLLVGSGLLLQSFVNLSRVDPGFRPNHVLTAGLALPRTFDWGFARRCEFFQTVLERVRTLPNVRSVGFTSVLPLQWKEAPAISFLPDGPANPAVSYSALDRVITPGYFEAMEIRLREGRFFDEHDGLDAPEVAIVNDAMAHKFWPNEDVIGKRIGMPAPGGGVRWTQIVGVVENVRSLGLEVPSKAEMYFPYRQADGNYMLPNTLVVRTTGDESALASALRGTIWSVNPNQPITYIRTMDDVLDDEFQPRRTQAVLLTGLAVLALILACVGIYGLITYFVTQRYHEIGIRMALGADSGDILGVVLGRGAMLTLVGVSIGLLMALLIRRLMDSLLFGVAPFSSDTFVGGAFLLSAVALAASYIPARRATRVDPMVALRHD
jgi:putative ABC transport system permease protein